MIPLRSLLLFKSLLLSSLMITVSASNKNRNGVNKYKVPFSIQKQRSAQEAAVPVTYPNGHPSCPCQPLDNIAPAVWEEMSPQARFELGGTNESLPVYGLGCGLHDVIINPYCHGSKRAEYCSRRFCYVNPNQCDLANRWSAYFEGRFFRCVRYTLLVRSIFLAENITHLL